MLYSISAYLASVGGCAEACRELDPAYSSAHFATDPYVLQALSGHNALLSEALTPEAALAAKQKTLTALADEASWREQLAASLVVGRAVLLSEAEPGARAFLAASPVGRTRMDSAVFVAELRQRLGMPDAASDLWCMSSVPGRPGQVLLARGNLCRRRRTQSAPQRAL